MTSRHSLSWIGRRKRRECARKLGSQLKETLETESGEFISVMVTDKKYLDAFRSRPFSQPLNKQLGSLKRRIDSELRPYQGAISVDYVVRGNRLYHLAVGVTLYDDTMANNCQINHPATR